MTLYPDECAIDGCTDEPGIGSLCERHARGSKVCTMCEQELPLDQFHQRHDRPSGVASSCRDCLARTKRYQRGIRPAYEEPKLPWADHVATYGGAPTFDMTNAACKNYPQVSFFSKEHIIWARSICDGCPIKADCLAYAMSCYEIVGVWGGTSRDERFPTPKRQPRKRGLSMEQIDGGKRWSVSYLGHACLADGSRLRVVKKDLVVALAALLKLAEGIPTAEREIAAALGGESRGLRNAGLPKPTRTNVEASNSQMDVEFATSNMPSELQNVYSNWGE